MARRTAIALFTLLLSAVASAATAAPRPDGAWQIISDQDGKPLAVIRVQTVNGALEGVLTASLRGDDPHRLCEKCSGALHNRQIIGMRVLWGLKPVPGDPLSYDGGSILDPDSGNVYQAKLSESPDGRTLTVRGFLGFALLGRTQIWRRMGG
jgi:uncharacterized protein (DUF2147 family)